MVLLFKNLTAPLKSFKFKIGFISDLKTDHPKEIKSQNKTQVPYINNFKKNTETSCIQNINPLKKIYPIHIQNINH